MPVVELEYRHLSQLTRVKNTKKLYEILPYLGLDIEGGDERLVRVEYSPNRPDYSTIYGIAAGLRYILGKSKPLAKFKIKSAKHKEHIHVDAKVAKIRPYIVGIIARGRKLDNFEIKSLMSMQEDLHSGLCRKRKKSSIGVHNLDSIQFPIRYCTVDRSHRFAPLGHDVEMSVKEILERTETGTLYSKLLKGDTHVPILMDSEDKTVSLPPVINAASTALKNGIDGIFVEVTGMGKRDVEDALSVVAHTLSEMGFTIQEVGISGVGNSTAKLLPATQKLSSKLVSKTIGLEMTLTQIRASLAKSGIYSKISNGNLSCSIPRHRFDIFSPMDLVEETMLGYGVQNLEPKLSPHSFVGSASTVAKGIHVLGETMIGLGCTETKNSALVDGASNKNLRVSKTGFSNTVLRSSLLDGLLGTFSHNVHEAYPQRLFEIGTVFGTKSPVTEEIRLCTVISHGGANYTEAKSLLQAILTEFGLKANTVAAKHPLMNEGQSAVVQVDGKKIGIVGTIDGRVQSNRKIRESISAFEITVSGLIFD